MGVVWSLHAFHSHLALPQLDTALSSSLSFPSPTLASTLLGVAEAGKSLQILYPCPSTSAHIDLVLLQLKFWLNMRAIHSGRRLVQDFLGSLTAGVSRILVASAEDQAVGGVICQASYVASSSQCPSSTLTDVPQAQRAGRRMEILLGFCGGGTYRFRSSSRAGSGCYIVKWTGRLCSSIVV